jgi:hypothetical protein
LEVGVDRASDDGDERSVLIASAALAPARSSSYMCDAATT